MHTVEAFLKLREAQGLRHTIFARMLVALSALIITPMVAQIIDVCAGEKPR